MAYCHIFILFLTAVTASPRSKLVATDAEQMLQALLNSKPVQQQVRNEHKYYPHNDNYKRPTNIETINFVFKNNKIVPLGSIGYSLPNPSAKTGEDKTVMLSKLGLRCGGKSERCGCGGKSERCGCSGKSERCGCSRSDGLCELDNDNLYDDTMILQPISDQKIVGIYDKYRNRNLNDKKNRVDPTIIKLLDDLENSLVFQSNNQNSHDLDERNDEKTSTNNLDSFIKDLEIVLNHPEKYDDDDENVAHLRCCKNCGRKSYSRIGDNDDRAYLRCCNKCGKNKYSRTDETDRRDRDDGIDGRSRYNDRESIDSERDILDQYLQTLFSKDRSDSRNFEQRPDKNRKDRSKQDRREIFDRNSKNTLDRDGRDRSDKDRRDRSYEDRRDEFDRERIDKTDRDGRNRLDKERKDRSDSNSIGGAKIFQVNDDLDAIVLDASDIDNVVKLLNIGNKYDNANSFKDYIGAVNLGLNENPKASKYQNRLVPSKFQQMKIKDMYRRSGQPSEGVYGVPFELDVQGLGQVNP